MGQDKVWGFPCYNEKRRTESVVKSVFSFFFWCCCYCFFQNFIDSYITNSFDNNMFVFSHIGHNYILIHVKIITFISISLSFWYLFRILRKTSHQKGTPNFCMNLTLHEFRIKCFIWPSVFGTRCIYWIKAKSWYSKPHYTPPVSYCLRSAVCNPLKMLSFMCLCE